MYDAPAIYVRFLDKHILSESGRLIFSILNVFVVSGYRVILSDTISIDPDTRIGQLTLSLGRLEVSDAIPGNSQDFVYLFDREDKQCAGKKWKRKIQLGYDIFSSYWLTKKPILMPYPMHPVHWGHHGKDMYGVLRCLRKSQKRLRLFFSGDTNGYNRPKVKYPDVKLSRPEIIEILLQRLPDDSLILDDETTLSAAFAGDYLNKFVVLDTTRLWVDDALWLDRLSRADFFLSPPGICMPMCHNVIEAMALGVIPVINYPEWFSPGLEHMKNCIAFGDADDLARKVRHVLGMGERQIAELRNNVISYYQEHLRPETFVRRIEQAPGGTVQVLMVTEKYVNKNSSKLGKRSILMR
ncbi:hypothetical protein Tel_13600 [Candidatus Tenderia electrophaga]|jgi:hypothetical protein|uniref:Exostosin GT47 domain-containing protein n=1 Tax=Candidatus Tenderia electrophaga TaxID=1748243 RepID=A0A0S2TG35_9GAMM|nr:hypothetical protein Tel_13600 [Candidatus Tenderia electrophaga]